MVGQPIKRNYLDSAIGLLREGSANEPKSAGGIIHSMCICDCMLIEDSIRFKILLSDRAGI